MKFTQITLIAAALAWPAFAAVAAEPSVSHRAIIRVQHNTNQHFQENLNDLVSRATVQKCGSGQIADDCKRWCGCAGKKGKDMFCQENDDVDFDTCKNIGCKCKN